MPALRTAEDMLSTELKDIYSAERQLSRALPKLAKKVSSDRLRELLDQRVRQGEQLLEQLDDAFEEIGVSRGRSKNLAAEGFIEDLTHHVDDVEDDKLLDPLLLASVQKIEHYCIAAWGTARSMGQLLDQQTVVQTMEQVLKEGKDFDGEMTRLAEEEINPRMIQTDEEAEEEDTSSKERSRRKAH